MYRDDSHSSNVSGDESIPNLQAWHQPIRCFGDDSASSQMMGLIIRQGNCVGGGSQFQEAMLSSENSNNYISKTGEEEGANKKKTADGEEGGTETMG